MANIFKSIFKGKILVVGVGNILRGDDAFGPLLVQQLQSSQGLSCFDVGTSPESYSGKIIKENPDIILIVDAVHLELKAGQYEILKDSQILKTGLTTHDISPKMFLDYLKKETGADIYILGVQPQSISLGEEMSSELKNTLEEVTNLIKEALYA